MATTKKQAATKELTVVAIYKFKTNGKLNGTRCTLARNAEGKEHKVWTHANGLASHCDCEGFEKCHGRRKCYHINFVEAIEAARKSTTASKAATLATPVIATNKPLTAVAVAMMSAEEFAALPVEQKLLPTVQPVAKTSSEAESQRRTSAPLNGNQGFSLLKKAS